MYGLLDWATTAGPVGAFRSSSVRVSSPLTIKAATWQVWALYSGKISRN